MSIANPRAKSVKSVVLMVRGIGCVGQNTVHYRLIATSRVNGRNNTKFIAMCCIASSTVTMTESP